MSRYNGVSMAARTGEELLELEARQEPRLVKALEMVAPGTAVREGIDNILQARTGGLIVIGDPDELAFLFSGGIKLDIEYSPALLYQVAKMDGAIALTTNATKIAWANVQLMPDPTILSVETGTRHRTAERVSKQTDALVIAISQRRDVVSLYVDGSKYILADIPAVLAKANQALATLDKYRTRLDQVSTRLTALEFEGGVTLHDVLTVLQRSELVTRMAVEIERFIVELGTEGRLIEMQLEETMVGVAGDKAALVHDYLAEHSDDTFATVLDLLARLGHQDLLDFGRLAELLGYDRKLNTLDYPASPRGYRILGRIPRLPKLVVQNIVTEFAGLDEMLAATDQELEASRASARSVRRTSARAFAGCRRSTSWTATCRRERGGQQPAPWRRRKPFRRRSKSRSRTSKSLVRKRTSSTRWATTSSTRITGRGRSSRRRQGHPRRAPGVPDDQDPPQRHDGHGPRARTRGGRGCAASSTRRP